MARAPDDGLVLTGCRITNAVRCVPPQNKPLPDEIAACRGFLNAALAEMQSLSAILALGKIAFDTAIRAARAKSRRNTSSAMVKPSIWATGANFSAATIVRDIIRIQAG